MSDQPTPRTDAAKRELCQRSKVDSNLPNDWNWVVTAELAENLERQRDEALELARELRDALGELRDFYVGLTRLPPVAANAALDKAKEVLP